MTSTPSVQGSSRFRLPAEALADLDPTTAARIVAASSDIALVIDRNGVIRDVALTEPVAGGSDFAEYVERKWVDTVTTESRQKVEELLNPAQISAGDMRWREINHRTSRGSVPVRYITIKSGHDGKVIALGRDQRKVAELQQRLLQAQQDMEREYVRLRQSEARYRLLFQVLSEAILVVDPASRKILEINPAATAMLGTGSESLVGQPFTRLFASASRDSATSLIKDAMASTRFESTRVRLENGGIDVFLSASSFRQDAGAHVLVRMMRVTGDVPADHDDKSKLVRVLNRIPDAFVVTDGSFEVIETNLAFLELAHLTSVDAAKGRQLASFLGRPGVDLSVISANLREHGWVRNFATVFNADVGTQEDVEISGVAVRDGLEAYFGFIIRAVRPRLPERADRTIELPRTAEQLKGLVGRMSLKDIVRETTDVIERMCVEAALGLTNNNRASAAEILGLSRQSLYSKLSRFGISGPESED